MVARVKAGNSYMWMLLMKVTGNGVGYLRIIAAGVGHHHMHSFGVAVSAENTHNREQRKGQPALNVANCLSSGQFAEAFAPIA
jgi:hypothetical protein